MLAQSREVAYVHEPFNPLTDVGLTNAGFTRFLTYVSDHNGDVYRAGLERSLGFRYSLGAQLRTIRDLRGLARTGRDAARTSLAHVTGRRPLMKDPIAVFSAPWLVRTFDMDVILTVRRPTAFVASFKRLGWRHDFAGMAGDDKLLDERLHAFRDEVRAAATHPPDMVSSAILLWRVVHSVVDQYRTDHPEWQVVRQEDLSRAPEAGFETLYRAVGLPYTDAIREVVRLHSSSSNPRQLRRTHDVALDSVASLEGWRSVLTDDERDRVERDTADVAERFYPTG